MIEDENDPHRLLRTLVSFGVVVEPVDGLSDLYTAACPFNRHPRMVDTIAGHREAIAADPDKAAIADEFAAGWRERERWRPAFQVRPLHGLYCCFGCGVFGGLADLTKRLVQREGADHRLPEPGAEKLTETVHRPASRGTG